MIDVIGGIEKVKANSLHKNTYGFLFDNELEVVTIKFHHQLLFAIS